MGSRTVRQDGRCERRTSRRQRGVVAIIFSVALVVMLGFIGMALDLGRLYNRQVELQAVANAAALAAARELSGTAAGIISASAAAAAAATALKYQYNGTAVTWSDAALRFSASPDAGEGDWSDVATATGAPAGLAYAKVDTSQLGNGIGTLDTTMMQVFGQSYKLMASHAQAIAGRASLKVTPIAVCALSTTAAQQRGTLNELVEYGFRRGVGYDLMNLNGNGTTPANFVIDPIDPPGVTGSASNLQPDVLGPFVCTGTIPMARLTGATVAVSSPLPLASLYKQLNSRFDTYTDNLCKWTTAPPDTNIKSYLYGSGVTWMKYPPTVQTAQSATDITNNKLYTVADQSDAPASAPLYGPLWSYAKAVPYSAYQAAPVEPAAGYTPFGTGSWATLYPPGALSVGYPSVSPYMATSGATFTASSLAHGRGIRLRRVLNVPLLDCSGGSAPTLAKVLAVGRFFMTVPATATSLSTEFGGIATEKSLSGTVELY